MLGQFQRGVSLIEVLVSVVLFSAGILGMAALQLNALKSNQTSSVRCAAGYSGQQHAG